MSRRLAKSSSALIERVEDHAFDLFVGQAVGRLHFDLGLLAAALLARGDLENAVGVDEELDFDARQAGAHRRNAFEIEARQRAAVGGEFALALHDVDGDVGLAVDAGGEVLGGRRGNGRVALNDLRDGAAERFNAERERRDVEQQHLFGGLRCAGENVGLHGGAERDDFVRIQFDVRLLAARSEMEEIVDELANGGNARGSADQDDFIDLLGRDAGIGESLFAGPTVRLSTGSINCSKTSRGISR